MPYSTNDLTPNTNILVRGRTTFSRIARRVEGEELEREKARERARGARVIHDKPYTCLSIDQAEVVMRDPNNPTKEEIWAQEHLFTSNSGKYTGYCFTARNKSTTLPKVCLMNGLSGTAPEMEEPLPAELANGLLVTMVLRVFQAMPNNGVSLDRVILHEPIRYYNSSIPDLSAWGMTIKPAENPAPQAPATAAPQAQPAAPAPVPNTAAPAPVAPPTGNPFTTVAPQQPQQQPPMGMPAPGMPPVQPAAPANWPTYGQPAQPAPGEQQNAPTPGIRYNLDNRNY